MAAAAIATRRQASTVTAAPAAARPQCNIHATAVVADKAQLLGPRLIEIGEGTMVHPYSRIRAEAGNVFVGRGCIVAEKAVVGSDRAEAGCILGDGVSIESGAVVEARRVGDHTTVEIGAKLGAGCMVGSWCKVGAKCVIAPDELVEDYTVVFGDGLRRVDRPAKEREEVRSMRMRGRAKELELLRSLIPDGKAKWLSSGT